MQNKNININKKIKLPLVKTQKYYKKIIFDII